MQISDELLKLVSDLEIDVFNGAPRPAIVGSFGRLRAALSALSLPVQPVASVSAPSGELAATTGEDKYRAWCEVKRAEFADDPADLPGILRMLDRWGPEALPADDNGQVHFARSLLDSAAEAIRKHLATTPPVPPTKGPEDDLIAAREAAASPCGIASPSYSDCPNMKEVGGGMEGERYWCALCSKGYFLDYEDMK